MKIIMYFIIFCCISASGVVAGGAKSLVWTSIRPTTHERQQVEPLAQEGNYGIRTESGRACRERPGRESTRNVAWRRGKLVFEACQSPTKIGNWIRAGRQPPTGLTPCFL